MVDLATMKAKRLIMQWHDRAQIDYSDLFMRLYVSYNAWYRGVTGLQSDYDAIKHMQERFVIWDDYIHGCVMEPLRSVMQQITILTALRPLKSSLRTWCGVVSGPDDWQGLILYWYTVRCTLFHGDIVIGHAHEDTQIKLAYESLNIFMTEIVTRMKRSFDAADYDRLRQLQAPDISDKAGESQQQDDRQQLYEKYITSPDLWDVDMIRA